ncbi:SDR family oxidoreductase, partial [Streptomyces sp. OR43]
ALAADRGIALGRLGNADEVAYAVTALLSPRASYITGTTVDVCGGVNRAVA